MDTANLGHFNRCKGDRIDPMLSDVELPLARTFHPAGFPLHLATNSPHVIDAACESWGEWDRMFDVEALHFRVVVRREGAVSPAPAYRVHAGLLSFIGDRDNFATADIARLTAAIFVSGQTAADRTLLRWLYLDAMAYMLLTQRYVVSLHAACVARAGAAILLCGRSGAGKSTLSVACARAGFTFLADDCTWILTGAATPVALGKPHQARLRADAARHFPELAGLPSRALPNGKVSMEVATSLLTGVTTATQSTVGRIVFLDRRVDAAPHLEPMKPSEVEGLLLADLPSYGPAVNAAHERTVALLSKLPAHRLTYTSLADAIRLLSQI